MPELPPILSETSFQAFFFINLCYNKENVLSFLTSMGGIHMKLGFIGCGNMATAIISGILKNNLVPVQDIMVSDVSAQALERANRNLGVSTTSNNSEVVSNVDVLVLAVKPQFCKTVISEIAQDIPKSTIIVSIMAGLSLKKLESLFERTLKIVRTMPNTPALVLEGITAICGNDQVSTADMELVTKLFESFGIVEQVSETLMDAVVAVSGSAPAYIFMLIEAMADAAVAEGMPRDKAYRFAAQTVLGSAKMVLETGKHPAELKDMVCSPAGTTIEAVRVLEKTGFRGSIMDAMRACAEKSRKLS